MLGAGCETLYMDGVEYGDMATWPSAGKGLPLQGNVFAVTWEGSGKGFGVWWTVQAEVLAGQSRTPAVIPGAAPPRPRLSRDRRIQFILPIYSDDWGIVYCGFNHITK